MLIFSILWFCFISGCVGCVIGLALAIRFQHLAYPHTSHSTPEPEAGPNRDEIKALLRSLVEINSQVDAQVGRHTDRISEITESMDQSEQSEPLAQTAKLLVAANQQLQIDLVQTRFELAHQRELVDSFKQESNTDALTKLMNRRAFDSELREQLEKVATTEAKVSLLFVDIDYFKNINDIHGHLNGDQVLSTVAECLKSSLYTGASAFRYGGEEFAVILPGSDAARAVQAAEHVRRTIERHRHMVDGQELTVTVSIGIAEALPTDTCAALIQRSDQALFTAKNSGRNRCGVLESVPVNASAIIGSAVVSC
ncbi:GGDEF domain-containing protein [Schlesneria paludicola]|uniref:GGDEF domain-containing protein n=1 Tax=Schlesneria paludicola TaxID=360056 RepID=UPI00029A672B|nr:GGDEF domain-containing protein [Schlesneria paludicola]